MTLELDELHLFTLLVYTCIQYLNQKFTVINYCLM